MSNGKKYTAAEKHFIVKEVQYQKQLKQQRETIVSMNAIQTELILDKHKLQTENAQLKEHIERLLEYTGLSQADIKKACEQDKKHGEAVISFMQLVGLTKQYL